MGPTPVAVLMLLLMSSPVGAATSPAQGAEFQKLTASPERLKAGDHVKVSGGGCAGGNEVRFDFYDPDLHSSAYSQASSEGTFAQLIKVPTTARVGRAWLRASCQTPESGIGIRQAILLITRPTFVVTWTNVLFGLGTTLLVAGFGLALLRRPQGRGLGPRRFRPRRSRGRKRPRPKSLTWESQRG